MTNDKLNPNDENRKNARRSPARIVRYSDFDIPSSFVIRVSSFCLPVERQTIVFAQVSLSGERLPQSVQEITKPSGVGD